MAQIKEYSTFLKMKFDDKIINSGLCIVFEKDFINKNNPRLYLNPDELIEFDNIKADKVKHNFCIGRYCAKKSISLISSEQNLSKIEIEHGVFGFPIVNNSKNLQVSIAHTDDSAVAISFNEKIPMGIDIEIINQEQIEVIETQLTQSEIDLCKELEYPNGNIYHQLWTSKEALSKAIKTGFTIPMFFFEINSIQVDNKIMIIKFKYFQEFKAISQNINDNYIVSIVLPQIIDFEKSSIQFP